MLHDDGFCLILLLCRLFIVFADRLLLDPSLPLLLSLGFLTALLIAVPLHNDRFSLISLLQRLFIILLLACFSVRHCCCSALVLSPRFSLLFRFTTTDFP
jgi:hypothetical protein